MTENQFIVSCLLRLQADLSYIDQLICRVITLEGIEGKVLIHFLSEPNQSIVEWQKRLPSIFDIQNIEIPDVTSVTHLASVVVPKECPTKGSVALGDLRIGLKVAQNSVELIQIFIRSTTFNQDLVSLDDLRHFYEAIYTATGQTKKLN